ncbi:barstar family protein [Acetobacter sp.]|jgi:hypothetical protein|uniref:barstar family protein n=1 Tax=Acetobacter sp. TaxID=440 RepID=UPI0025C543AB|nr:barstar family protein [Acetobacter sp.]MCH4091693.1 barstar family protein [Acetobacter sp.]MCI1300889.1 barstar family protein [Acetobacter sp.]MCI1316234.1 barstar family protein [Acetobacter sp.]
MIKNNFKSYNEEDFRSVFKIVISNNIKNKSDFFLAIKENFLLDPPINSLNWDALSDSFYESINNLEEKKILIIFENLIDFFYLKKYDFIVSLNILNDLSEEIFSPPKKLKIYIVFDGNGNTKQLLSNDLEHLQIVWGPDPLRL